MTREEAIDVLKAYLMFDKSSQQVAKALDMAIEALKDDAVQGWNNHEVACILAELFGDDCACNYNGIDEWLPMVCDFKDNCQTVGVACWEQFLKHYNEKEPPTIPTFKESAEAYKAWMGEEMGRPQWEWIQVEDEPYIKCKKCGVYFDDLDEERFNFCPNCGADMRGAERREP